MSSSNKKTIYRAIIIGCGNIGALLEADPLRPKPATYAGAFTKHKKIELVGLVDLSESILKKAHGLFPGVKTYQDAELCIKQTQPAIVAIATPPDTHYHYLHLCKKYRIAAVICEKPMSESLAGAKKIERLFKRSKMLIVINHQRRFFPLFKEARKKIQDGILGAVRQVTTYYSNGIINNGSHLIDTLRFLLRDEVAWVSGAINVNNNTRAKFDSNIDGLLHFRSGAVVTMQCFDQAIYGIHELNLFGDKGELAIGGYGYEFRWIPVRASRCFANFRELAPSAQKKYYQKVGMVEGVVDHVVDCLRKKKKSDSTLRDGAKALSVLLALIQSAKSGGRRVYIKN